MQNMNGCARKKGLWVIFKKFKPLQTIVNLNSNGILVLPF